MAKISAIALIVVFSLGVDLPSANTAEPMGNTLGRAFGAKEIIGVHGRNPQGQVLGRISDLVVDSEGRLALVVLSYGGFLRFNEKQTAVPFRALRYDETARNVILDTTKEKLAAAPRFKMSDLPDRNLAEDAYRYFGEQPYWSDGEGLFKGLDEPLGGLPKMEPLLPFVAP
jgi:hypothetical protein